MVYTLQKIENGDLLAWFYLFELSIFFCKWYMYIQGLAEKTDPLEMWPNEAYFSR